MNDTFTSLGGTFNLIAKQKPTKPSRIMENLLLAKGYYVAVSLGRLSSMEEALPVVAIQPRPAAIHRRRTTNAALTLPVGR